jgi:hypothetical protein
MNATMTADGNDVMLYNRKFIRTLQKPKPHIKSIRRIKTNSPEDAIFKCFDQVFNLARFILSSENNIQENIQTIFPNIFELRIQLLSRIINYINSDAPSTTVDIYSLISKDVEDLIRKDKKYNEFGENLLFAVRCSRKATEIIKQKLSENNQSISQPEMLPTSVSTYNAFLSTLSITYPDKVQLNAFIKWINSSLVIEFSIVSMILFNNEKIKINKTNLTELASLTAEAGQTHLGFVLSNLFPNKNIDKTGEMTKEEIKREKELADLGLEDLLTLS